MPLPVTIPNTFANATTSIPLSQLDSNFSTLANAINGINSGSETVANLRSSNVTITGGIISNVTLDNVTVDVETLSNVTINGGNVTVTNMVATTANANTINVTTINARDGTASMSLANTTGILSLSNALVTTAGTSAAPAITTTGDTNTGIFFPAADTIAFSEGGAESMRIDSSGNVSIGATSSSSQAFRVSQTAFPNVPSGWYANSGDGNAEQYGITRVDGTNGRGIRFQTTLDGSNLPYYSISTGTAASTIAGMTWTERMRITSSGSVGIGTSSPNGTLHVAGTANFNTTVTSGDFRYNGQIFLVTDSQIAFRGTGDYIYSPAANTIAVLTGGTERMRIDSSGNIRAEKAVRATITADNDGSFDMNAASNFTCTPTGAITLTFTNITSGQSGNILLVNNSNYAITAAATTKVATGALTTLSATGTYWLSYFSNGTNVYIANTGALA